MDVGRILIGTSEGLRTPTDVLVDDVDVVAIAPSNDGAWWLIDGGAALVRYHSGRAAPIASIDGGLLGRSVVDHHGTPLVGTSEAHLLRLHGASLEPVASFDLADGRAAWYTPWGGPADTRSIACDSDGRLFVNVHVGGILRSADGGDTWDPTLDIDDDVHLDKRIATLAALLFAVHPAHVEPVAWIAALPELAYTLCFLLALYFYIKESPSGVYATLASCAFYGMALLWKESAITFLLCVIFYDWIVVGRLRPRRYACLAGVVLGYLGLRNIALAGLAPHVLYADVSTWMSLLTAVQNIGMYFAKLTVPVHLSFYYPVTFVKATNGTVVCVVLAAIALAWKLRGKRALAAAWIVITLLPALVVTRVAVPVSERNLYLASVGFCWLLAEILMWFRRRNALFLAGSLVIACIAVDFGRVADWRDDLVLWQKALLIYPEDEIIRLNIASELGRRHQYDAAITYLDEILGLNPNHLEALTSKAGLLASKQDWTGVSETCGRVFRIDKNSAHCILDAGLVAQGRGQLQAAKEYFDLAHKNNPGLWQALFHQGNLALEMGKPSDAARSFERLLERNPSAPVFNNLGSAYARMGETEKAVAAFQAALRIDPSFEMATRNLTMALTESR